MQTPLLTSVFLFLAAAGAVACSSSSNAGAGPATSPGTAPGSSATTIDAADLGAACSGGCGAGEACGIEDATCPRGLCGYDYRFGDSERWVGCTADCTNAACPAGWECTDVLGPKTARACMKLPEPRLKLTVETQTIVWKSGTPTIGDLNLKLDTSVPAAGAADGCGKVVLLEDTSASSHLVATMCGTPSDGEKRVWELDFVVPKKKGRSTPQMTVITALVSKYDADDKTPVCGGAVTVDEVSERGARSGTITGVLKSPSCTDERPDATFVLDRAEFELRTPALESAGDAAP